MRHSGGRQCGIVVAGGLGVNGFGLSWFGSNCFGSNWFGANWFGASRLRRDVEAHLDFWAKRPGVHFPHRETKRVREGDEVTVELKVTQNARNIIR
jgi:hypothetical protein